MIMIAIRQTRLLLVLMASALSALSFGARAAEQLDTVTVEAQRIRELQREISHFVSRVVVRYMYDSLERWDTPICPLVAGLPQDRGEFVLARLSEIARASHVPVAGEHCRPNLYVVVTAEPDLLVEKWWKRDRRLVNTCNGYGYVRAFMHSKDPVRVWYNASFRSSDGAALSSDTTGLDLAGLSISLPLDSCAGAGGRPDSRLRYPSVKALTSVIIVVDAGRTTNLNIGQLADYVAMVGFAEIHPNAETGTAPTILSVFRQPTEAPQGLSSFDQAFLHSLYTTDQTNVMQVSTIKSGMLREIER
jgi:hypothetical protein